MAWTLPVLLSSESSTHRPHPLGSGACQPAVAACVTVWDEKPAIPAKTVGKVRRGSTIRTCLIAAFALMHGLPATGAKPGGSVVVHAAQSASVSPKSALAYCRALRSASLGSPPPASTTAAARAETSAAFCARRCASEASPWSTTSAASATKTVVSRATRMATTPLSSSGRAGSAARPCCRRLNAWRPRARPHS